MRLQTLGVAALVSSSGAEPVLGPGKALALLTYIALTPGRRISREFLVEMLWADLDPANARNALRQTVFHLRRLLGDGALVGTEELTLAHPVNSDRDSFLEAIEKGDLENALELYAGDFLPAFGVPGGALFEQWADLERDRLRAAFLRSAEIVVRRRLNESRFKDAQRLARRVRDEVPNAEAAWRLLLETTTAGRDFVSGAVEAQALEQWAAAEEFSLEPATIKAIARARRLTSDQGDAQQDVSLVAELTGREREFSAITLAWESARSSRSRHLHLTAPAGIGKTRLLRDAVARLRAAGVAVVECRALAGDRDIPYALAGDVAVTLAALRGSAGVAPASASALIALNPAVSSFINGQADQGAGDDVLRRRIQALTDLVHAVADEQPFVLTIDDMHWADASSFQVMEGVLARLSDAHVLCLTAARPECVPAGDTVTTLKLAPLTPQQVASFVLALGALPDGESWGEELVAGMHTATRGSPLLILETLRLAMSEEILVRENGEWRCHDEARLRALLRAGEALLQRLKTFPEKQRWLLALLATAGSPLSRTSLATAAGCSPDELSASLAALEINGWVSRAGDKWMPAHDEIARAGREALDTQQRARAEEAIGSLLLDAPDSGVNDIMRGIRHMIAAHREADVEKQFRRYARAVRERRDSRPFTLIAAEVLGEDAGTARVKTLVSSLPISWRFGLWSESRQRIAASVVGLIVLGGFGVARASATDAANTERLVYTDTTRVAQAFPVRVNDWDGRKVSVTGRREKTSLVDAALAFREIPPAISPDGKSVAWNQDSGDSTTIDIWIRTPAGTRRLTRHVRDDLVHDWLADGSGLVGVTSRWSSAKNGNYDVAIFDTATGAARQVTSGPAHDGRPLTSPDGTRIAFLREPPDGPPVVCVISIDGTNEPDCRMPAGRPVLWLAGWRGAREIVVTLESNGVHALVRYDWQHNQVTSLFDGDVTSAFLSPDHRWIAATARVNGIRGFRDWIIPVDDPASARMVDRTSVTAQARWWEGPGDRSAVIDRIEFTDSLTRILPGVGTRLRIRAFSSENVELPVLAPIEWKSSDTLIAVVDSTGNVSPRRIGTVTIQASLAGWRNVSRRLTVRGSPPAVVVSEQWDSGWRSRWITFGDPQPIVTAGPGGVASFWNRGDGSYQSLGILRRAFDAQDGLGLEISMSTPLAGDGDHRARVFLIADIDTVAFHSANQQKEAPSLGRMDALCGATYPTGNASYGRTRLAASGGTTRFIDVGQLASKLASGDWWTLRLQILPDGRCGVAVNNRVLSLSPEPINLDGKFFLRLGDESKDAKLLHGPLEVWTGVRTDIDWSGH